MTLETLVQVNSRPQPFAFPIGATALIVVDVQNDFCHPEGYCLGDLGLDGTLVRAILPALQNVVAWAREAGVPVVWTKEAHLPDLSDLSASKAARYTFAGYPVGARGRRGRYLVRGEFGSQVVPELVPREDELQFDKPAQSVFAFTNLEDYLRERDITHLLVAGVTTQCCVLATVRAANDLGFFALLLEDCCAAFDKREHDAAITVLTSEGGAVGWVSSSQDVFDGFSSRL